MKIDIDSNAGFCFGVVNAIGKAEFILKKNHKLNCLGDIVHNGKEIARLSTLGLTIINYDDLRSKTNETVLIRAHGEPPSTYQTAHNQQHKIIDATCPIVLKLQKSIKASWEEMKKVNGQVIIFGKPTHAEVIGLRGQTDDNAIIVEKEGDLSAIDFTKPTRLFSQTTMNSESYNTIISSFIAHMKHNNNIDFNHYDTICRSVKTRAKGIQLFAAHYPLILFVGSKNSSNGKALFKACKTYNSNTKFIGHSGDIDPQWFDNINSVGITGATSTPTWLMEEVKKHVTDITS